MHLQDVQKAQIQFCLKLQKILKIEELSAQHPFVVFAWMLQHTELFCQFSAHRRYIEYGFIRNASESFQSLSLVSLLAKDELGHFMIHLLPCHPYFHTSMDVYWMVKFHRLCHALVCDLKTSKQDPLQCRIEACFLDRKYIAFPSLTCVI